MGANAIREPDKRGEHGRAWEMTGQATRPDHAATIRSFIVNGYGYHPFWNHWLVGVCHLRDIPDCPAAVKHYPDAGYEFLILAIDPERHPKIDPDDAAECLTCLTPADVVWQFHGISDDDAGRLCGMAVDQILTGKISPDQDFRPAWEWWLTQQVERLRPRGES